jgi:hypothetical protein
MFIENSRLSFYKELYEEEPGFVKEEVERKVIGIK